jgi:DNA-binding CsgD family transcriptional regulator
MEVQHTDFIYPQNTIVGVTDEDYQREHARLALALNALSQVSHCGYYVVDYFKHNFLYVSDNIAYWCGHTADEAKELGYELYTQFVPQDDLAILKQINDAGFDKFLSLPEEERCKYTISFDFRFEINSRKKMVNKRLTPLALKDGKIWLALCILTMSSSKKTGQEIILKKNKCRTYFKFSLETRKWSEKTVPLLSDDEKDILRLAAQGLSYKEMADMFNKSPHTIKLYRKNLLEKIGAANFNEAIIHALNFGTFQL